jgi:hypothetical protein
VDNYFTFGGGGTIWILHRKVNYHNESYQTGVASIHPQKGYFWMNTRTGAIAIVMTVLLAGCLNHSDYDVRPIGNGITPTDYSLRPDPLVVFFFRESSYKGLGRIHELEIDDKLIGSMTADNYFRIELWPGEYQFSVYLPAEDFFGAHSPPENNIMRLAFGKSAGSGIFVYKYVDGDGIYRVEPIDDAVIARIEHTRVLSADLSARDTAQVKFLHGARYDGPASSGKAHGYGTLTWDDGSTLRGRFEYGETTQEGEFFTTEGLIYMGRKSKGRPIGPGVWITLDRRILYAGPFKDELPHGTGIRSGIEAPEFCVFENGKDVTKTIWQMANEAVDEEEKRIKEEKSVDIESKHITSTEDISNNYSSEATTDNKAEKSPLPPTGNQPLTASSLPSQEDVAAPVEPNRRPDVLGPEATRNERVSAKYKMIKRRIDQQIEEKRIWCQEEFALGWQLCKCAPFAIDFEQWRGCVDR